MTEPFVATASDGGPEVVIDPGAVTDPDQYSEFLPRTPRPPAVVPVSTYRLQIRPGFGFDDAAAVVGHLHSLGITHLYLSPVLQPAPSSVHGYDVVDHSRLNQEAGGRTAFDRLSAALSEHGMSAIADVVPNHMCVPRPARLNAALWSVLREGPASPFARWFDVDWSIPSRPILMPVLGRRIGQVLADGELQVDTDGSEPVLRYFDYEFPIRPGTERLPIEQLVDRQWYRLAWWRVADDELNYRRFFDVDTLVAIRVEEPEVFDASHALLIDLLRSGQLQGLRIDHPDGLANPRDYLGRLAEAAGDPWVVVEKILTGEETLPADWCCSGTTGYDALLVVCGLFLDPAGAAPLTALLTELTGDPPEFSVVVEDAKRQVVTANLYAEVARLVDLLVAITEEDISLRDHTRRHLRAAVIELLVATDRYRAYVVPGEPAPLGSVLAVEAATAVARGRLPEDAGDALDLVRDLVLGRPVSALRANGPDAERRREFVTRFQQTCGPAMAKGVEDTAFYRWHRLVALNEVGGDPARFGVPVEGFHAFAERLQQDWPATMTTLSTHDTKRSEDVRARLAVLAETPVEWAEAVRSWSEAAGGHRRPDSWPDPSTIYLLWQTLVGIWQDGPPDPVRVLDYLSKATREAKVHTSWTHPDPLYDTSLANYVTGVLADEDLMASVGAFCATIRPATRVVVLGQKLVQLTMPGVADVYQGTEIVNTTLVDPDNRRAVDFDALAARLARLDSGAPPVTLDDEKLLVTSRALRLRREHPDCFVGSEASYTALATSTGNAVAFARGNQDGPEVVTVVTRLPLALSRLGGWREHTVTLPPGTWRDTLTGRRVGGGSQHLATVLEVFPVALLTRES